MTATIISFRGTGPGRGPVGRAVRHTMNTAVRWMARTVYAQTENTFHRPIIIKTYKNKNSFGLYLRT